MLQGERDLATVSNLVLTELAPLVNAQHGVFYVADRDDEGVVLNLAAPTPSTTANTWPRTSGCARGLVGQCAYEKQRILLTSVPERLRQGQLGPGRGHAAEHRGAAGRVRRRGPRGHRTGHPGRVQRDPAGLPGPADGVHRHRSEHHRRQHAHRGAAQAVAAAHHRASGQQNELKTTNDRLEQQAASLRQSEELLRTKQEELQATNVELEDKAVQLGRQNQQVEAKNREVEQAKAALEEKAEQLALTSKYKSEFLANMSHELRTPLNSLLILSKLLAGNSQGNLTDKQVEFARNIHDAGADLMALINDILDLSKIESGTVTLDVGELSLGQLKEQTQRMFAQIAQEKKLDFHVEVADDLPRSMYTDDKRLQQVIKNLLSNAFKFTSEGSVTMRVFRADGGWSASADHLAKAGQVVAFSVTDTGIGIPEEKQRLIFEAFQQADGTTSRKYGGTGLGLSISREITRLLGGELKVVSRPGEGSTFTLYVPLTFNPAAQPAPAIRSPGAVNAPNPFTRAQAGLAASAPNVSEVEPAELVLDDRDDIAEGDCVVLIVEDDSRFASILLQLAREAQFKGVVTGEGGQVIALAKRFHPHAILLDLGLPDMDGWALLDMLKRTPETRHIAVNVISATDQRGLGLAMGAFGYTSKPVEKESVVSSLERVKSLVNSEERRIVVAGKAPKAAAVLSGYFKPIHTAPDLARALKPAKGSEPAACIVVEIDGDMNALDKMKGADGAPIVIFIARELTAEEERRVRMAVFAGQARVARTPEQLVDEVIMRLHEPLDTAPEPVRTTVTGIDRDRALLAGKKVLVIDDDIRNIFSLTSALEEYGIDLLYAESGREGLDLLAANPETDVALVDIMMPDMDGYETIGKMRLMPQFAELPIVAVTAKAMKGDRQKCIQAGASDYVSKPVDVDHLVSVLRVGVQRAELNRTLRPDAAPAAE
jgi:signal transduction histidine kinase/DNA-binding response OmpR family regulator